MSSVSCVASWKTRFAKVRSMLDVEVCPTCRNSARREKTLWSTIRPPVHVFVCDPCQHTFLVNEQKLDLQDLVPNLKSESLK